MVVSDNVVGAHCDNPLHSNYVKLHGLSLIVSLPGKRNNLVSLLHKAQNAFALLPLALACLPRSKLSCVPGVLVFLNAALVPLTGIDLLWLW